jgi:hypothetical protein
MRAEFSPELHQIAQRLVWWKAPEEALADFPHFVAQVMTLGTWNDLKRIRAELGEEALRETLCRPPSGIFDARSWHYWHHYFGILPIPPLPKRRLE